MVRKIVFPILFLSLLVVTLVQRVHGDKSTTVSYSGSNVDSSSQDIQQMMGRLQGMFSRLEKTGFFDQMEQTIGSASSSFGGTGSEAQMAKQLRDQLKQAMSEGGVGDQFSKNLGSALDGAGAVGGGSGQTGQIAKQLTSALNKFTEIADSGDLQAENLKASSTGKSQRSSGQTQASSNHKATVSSKGINDGNATGARI